MWGAVLFSPFPLWLSLSSRLAGIVTYLIAALTLLPIPFWSLANPQLLHSKSRHIFAAPAKSADQELLLRELMPLLRSYSSASHGVTDVLADPQVNHSLQAFAEGRLSLVAPAYRLTRLDQKPNVTGLQSDDSIQVLRALRSLPLSSLPAWVVQRRLTRCSYSVYVDSKDYDSCVSQLILNRSVNQLRPQDLAGLGYEVVIDEGDVILWSLPQHQGRDRPHGRTQ